MSANKRIPAIIITVEGQYHPCFWDANKMSTPSYLSEVDYATFNSVQVGYTFQETEARGVVVNEEGGVTANTVVGKWYRVKNIVVAGGQKMFIMEETNAPAEPTPLVDIITLFDVIKTIAHQLGIEQQEFDSMYSITKSIFDKYTDGREVKNTNTNEILDNILDLLDEGLIKATVKPNKLTYNGSVWKFETMPDVGAYVAGDLYVNSSKVGTYNGFICKNTLSNWEEAALSISSTSFGNQAICLLRENNGEWQLK